MKALCTDAPMLLNQLGITAEIIEQELEKIQVLESIKVTMTTCATERNRVIL